MAKNVNKDVLDICDVAESNDTKPLVQTLGQQLEAEKRENKEKRNKIRQAAKARDKVRYMYMGPNIPVNLLSADGTLFNGSIYTEMPTHFDNLFEAVPEIKALFLKVEQVPNFKKEVQDKGSTAHYQYQQIENLIRAEQIKRHEAKKAREEALKNGI